MLELISHLNEWFSVNQEILTWITIGSVFTFVVSLLSLPWLVSLIPEDYFLAEKREPPAWKSAHPLLRALVIIIKNVLGFMLFLGGVMMLFLPGQGILTIAMGLLLMDYPGKFEMERKLVARPGILRSLNWLRGKKSAPPLHVSTDLNKTH